MKMQDHQAAAITPGVTRLIFMHDEACLQHLKHAGKYSSYTNIQFMTPLLIPLPNNKPGGDYRDTARPVQIKQQLTALLNIRSTLLPVQAPSHLRHLMASSGYTTVQSPYVLFRLLNSQGTSWPIQAVPQSRYLPEYSQYNLPQTIHTSLS